jgi:hypothetical protein
MHSQGSGKVLTNRLIQDAEHHEPTKAPENGTRPVRRDEEPVGRGVEAPTQGSVSGRLRRAVESQIPATKRRHVHANETEIPGGVQMTSATAVAASRTF